MNQPVCLAHATLLRGKSMGLELGTSDGSFERLCGALFGGESKAVDFKTMPGSRTDVDREELSYHLLRSLERVGLVKDGVLVDKNA